MLQDWRGLYTEQGLTQRTVDIIAASWKGSTKSQYQVYIKKWKHFCAERKISYLQVRLSDVLEFLTKMLDTDKVGYSTLNTARSALSSFLVVDDGRLPLGSHPVVNRFMKGVFHLRPPAPRYSSIWDVKIVLDYLRKQSPAKALNLKQLTLKLTMLIALVSAQRAQSIHQIHLDRMRWRKSSVELCFENTLKQNKPGNTGLNVTLDAYPPDRRLCIVNYMKEYVERTRTLRGIEKHLLITCKKPHHRASKQTIARWIKTVMRAAGIDTQIFKAHSTRAASTSAARRCEVPVSDILSKAGWASEKTFRKFYCKPLLNSGQFARALLKQ